MTVLACERDATMSLKLDEVVDCLAAQSAALKKHLFQQTALQLQVAVTVMNRITILVHYGHAAYLWF